MSRVFRAFAVVCCVAAVPLVVVALPSRIEFRAGDPIRAADMNASFATLWEAVQDLEDAPREVPAGTVIAYYGSEAPGGWLVADGSEISSDDNPEYAELVAHLQDMGLGVTANSATLPDLRGVFLRGQDRERGQNLDAGDDAIGRLQGGALQAHAHAGTTESDGSHSHPASSDSAGDHTHDYDDNSGWSPNSTPSNTDYTAGESGIRSDMGRVSASAGAHTHGVTVATAGAHTHAFTTGNTGGSETRPVNVTVLHLIRY